jgi:hypothetical protein
VGEEVVAVIVSLNSFAFRLQQQGHSISGDRTWCSGTEAYPSRAYDFHSVVYRLLQQFSPLRWHPHPHPGLSQIKTGHVIFSWLSLPSVEDFVVAMFVTNMVTDFKILWPRSFGSFRWARNQVMFWPAWQDIRA